MTKTKTTKRALLMSALSLLLCVSMLVGTTFAWFTDSVTSGSNIIRSGNLDVTMHYMDGKNVPTADSSAWLDAADASIFNYDKWEPGYTEVRHIKIGNNGSLALKYKLNILANGEVGKLAEVIDVYYIDPAVNAITDRAQLVEDSKLGTLDTVLKKMGSMADAATGYLESGDNVIVTVALKMQETAGNEYQNLSIGTDFTVQLMATQMTAEMDSFDILYDEDAWLNEATYDWYDPDATTLEIRTAAELAGLAQLVNGTATSSVSTYSLRPTATMKDTFAGKTVKLMADIDLNGALWTPIGVRYSNKAETNTAFSGTFDGNGHTVSNLAVNTEAGKFAGLFGSAVGPIKNVTVKNAIVKGSFCTGVVVGHTYASVINCHVEDAKVICTPARNDEGLYVDGNNAGVVIGYAEGSTITGCSAVNSSVSAFRCVGGLVGTATGGAKVTGNSLDSVDVTYVMMAGAAMEDNKVNGNAAAVSGRVLGTSKVSDNTFANVTVLGETYAAADSAEMLADALAVGGNIVLADNVAADASMEIPAGVTATLDLNGNTVTGGKQADPTKSVYAIENKGTLTLKNGTVNSRGVANYGTLIIEDGVYNAVDNNGGAAIWNYAGSNVEVNGGTFTAAQATAAPAATVMHVADGATAVVNGGTFKSDADWTYAIISYGDLTINDANISGEHGAIAAETGKLTINGGTYEVTASGHLIYSRAATITLNGGSFKHSQIGASAEGNVILYASGSAKATVNGGSYDSVEGAFAYPTMTGNITITGGIFANKAATIYHNGDLAQFVAAGYNAISYGSQSKAVVPAEADRIATSTAELKEAVKEKNAIVYLPSGNYEFEGSIAEGVTLVGGDNVVFEDTLSGTLNDTTFKNIHIKSSDAQRWAYSEGELLFENCTFEATGVYAIHYDGLNNANITYKNCKIVGWAAIGSGAEYVTFDGCQIYGNGSYGVLRLYSPCTIKNCTFDVADVNPTDVFQDGIHAVDCEIKVSNNTNVNGDMSALYNVSGTGKITEE